MRALRVVGLDEDGETVICEDPDNGDRFSVPADERLRAAARGDLTRLGQAQIEMEDSLRPREIQARVRSGATVEEIAETSGVPQQRVERYAYPVLLERAQIAELAQRAHPIREDGPDVQTLTDVVAHTFGMRGHEYAEASWDAWRGEDNKWVVRLHWTAGKSDNNAHWVFHPGAHGGTVVPVDDHAADLLDPSPTRALRTVRPVTELAREALELDQGESAEPGQAEPGRAEPGRGEAVHGQAAHGEAAEDDEEPRTTPAVPALEIDSNLARGSAARSEAGGAAAPAARPEQPQGRPERTADRTAEKSAEKSSDKPADRPADKPAGQQAGSPAAEVDEHDHEDEDHSRTRKSHPIVPSWEDVLLGVRSHR